MPIVDNPEYSLAKWEERMKNYGDLMIYASLDSEVIGIVFGRIDDNCSITIGPVAVHENYRGIGIAKEMIFLLEERAVHYGVHSITLGAVESAEGFYSKLGYTGSLLVQSQIHSIEQLLSLNNRYKVEFTNIYDGKVSQVCLELSEPDRYLQKEYEVAFPGCYTQMMYRKNIGTTS
ncbi:GNAT family N-acetyltransferase [Sporosalibacterium faouarense]|uniref:GNAT family N-acetyltransferase n=1 Tax=Sporosalibacterium faouarense TaxID=516123 RepID=UPI0024358538|nr:GNAT family N-acetyltransferase [Sporosalibacterium faouarense]